MGDLIFAKLSVSMDIETLRAPIADDLQAVNALIRRELHSDVALINQLAGYIIESGGKQYKAVEGSAIEVDLLTVEPGQSVALDAVLLVVDVGNPSAVGMFM